MGIGDFQFKLKTGWKFTTERLRVFYFSDQNNHENEIERKKKERRKEGK